MIQVLVAMYIMTDNDRIVTGAPYLVTSCCAEYRLRLIRGKKKRNRMPAARGYNNGDEIEDRAVCLNTNR